MPNISNTADLSFGNRATFGLGLLLHTDGIESGRRLFSGSWPGWAAAIADLRVFVFALKNYVVPEAGLEPARF